MKHFKIIVLIMALLLIIPNSAHPSELSSTSITPTSLIQPLTAIHPTYPIYSTALSPSGRYLAIGSTKKVILWDVVRKMELKTFPIEGRDVISLCFSPDGKTLAAGSYKTIELWDITTGNRITTFSGHNDYVTSLAFTPDGRSLASGSRGTDNSIIIWDVTEKRLERRMTYQSQNADIIRSLSFSRDGSLLASVGTDKTINIWDLSKDASTFPTKIKPSLSESPVVISFSPDKQILSYGTSDGKIILHNIEENPNENGNPPLLLKGGEGGYFKGTPVRTINAHQGEIFSISFSPDGNIITSTGRDKVIKRWNVSTGKIIDARALNYDLQPAYASTNGSQVALFNTQGGAVFALGLSDTIGAGIPPVIVITSPVNQQALDKSEVILTGKIADDQGISDVKIEVNGIVISPPLFKVDKNIPPPLMGGGQGEGEQRLSLDETNYGIEYYIEATDQFGNEGTDGEKARPYFAEVRESPAIQPVAGETGIGSTGLSTAGSEKPCDSIFCKPLFWGAVLLVVGGAVGMGGAGSGSKSSSNSNNNTTNVSVSW